MFAQTKRGVGGAAPMKKKRCHPEGTSAGRLAPFAEGKCWIIVPPPFTRSARCHNEEVCCEPKNKIIQSNVITMDT